jgi:hypothetical protein
LAAAALTGAAGLVHVPERHDGVADELLAVSVLVEMCVQLLRVELPMLERSAGDAQRYFVAG